MINIHEIQSANSNQVWIKSSSRNNAARCRVFNKLAMHSVVELQPSSDDLKVYTLLVNGEACFVELAYADHNEWLYSALKRNMVQISYVASTMKLMSSDVIPDAQDALESDAVGNKAALANSVLADVTDYSDVESKVDLDFDFLDGDSSTSSLESGDDFDWISHDASADGADSEGAKGAGAADAAGRTGLGRTGLTGLTGGAHVGDSAARTGSAFSSVNAVDQQAIDLANSMIFEISINFFDSETSIDQLCLTPERPDQKGRLEQVLKDCQLKINGKNYFFISNDSSGINTTDFIAALSDTQNLKNSLQLKSFYILGSRHGITVSLSQVDAQNARFVAKPNNSDISKYIKKRGIALFCGKLVCDAKQNTSQTDHNIQKKVITAAQSNPSRYLQLWTTYNEIEREKFAAEAEKRGYAKYSKIDRSGNANQIEFLLDQHNTLNVKIGDIVEVTEYQPDFIIRKGPSVLQSQSAPTKVETQGAAHTTAPSTAQTAQGQGAALGSPSSQSHPSTPSNHGAAQSGHQSGQSDPAAKAGQSDAKQNGQASTDSKPSKTGVRPKGVLGEVVSISVLGKKWLRIAFKGDAWERIPKTDGYISVSLFGYEMQMRRRKEALNAITMRRAGISHLHTLFEPENDEAQARLDSIARSHKEYALSDRVRNKVFAHDPTQNQIDAIDVALNTPDIALIQGPPGTGKTTIIQAIVERLTDILRQESKNDKTTQKSLQGEILISSFQHEAVDNAISRLSVNSLPTFKFGSQKDATNLRIQRACEQWQQNLSTALHQKYGDDLVYNDSTLNFQKACGQYVCEPTDDNARKLVEIIEQLPNYVLADPDIQGALQAEKQRLEQMSMVEDQFLFGQYLRKIFALRTDPKSYDDDGFFNLTLAFNDLHAAIRDPQLQQDFAALKVGARCYPAGPDEFFKDLKRVQGELIDHFKPVSDLIHPAPQKSVMELINKLNQRIKETAADYEVFVQDADHAAQLDQKVRQVLVEFTNTVDSDFDQVKRTLNHLNVVVAATVQQSVSRELLEFKHHIAPHAQAGISYDTVIIDEAARSSPIDLLIPIVLASRRVILVGDHKQLPHIVDEMVESKLEKIERDARQQEADEARGKGTAVGFFDRDSDDADDADDYSLNIKNFNNINSSDMLKLSMFEYLFHRLKSLELSTGVKRTVTLDSQFRMHPKLGELVSNEFYEGQIKSPLPANLFDHQLAPVPHQFACWFDVPAALGEEMPQGHSKIRVAEANAIITQVAQWLKDPASKDLSFGIVCFYREQVKLLMSIAQEHGLFVQEDDDDGAMLNVGSDFDDHNVLDRLRINTVDAFQGKEFDVVILSMVRSITQENLAKKIQKFKDKALRKAKRQAEQNAEGADGTADSMADTQVPQISMDSFEPSIFGHLMSTNRLCVALSRQKRMLCVFGDKELAIHPLGQSAVPALYHFYELCKNEGMVLTVDKEGQAVVS